jgi:ribonuclease G
VKGLAGAERDRLVTTLREIERPDEGFVLRAAASGASLADLTADVEALRARRRAIDALSRVNRPPAPLESTGAPLALLLGEFASSVPDAIIIDDRAAFAEARSWLARHQPELGDRLALHREAMPLFEHHGIAGEIAIALTPSVPLPGGGALTIEPTAAATMIDVDSGRSVGRGRQVEDAVLTVNLTAARVVARQVWLRNLAGPIVIDFIGMRRRGDRDRVRRELTNALSGDADTEVLGWTRLGHLEIVRKRRHAPLVDLLFERAAGGGLVKTPMTVALEALRTLARQADAAPGQAPILHVHPEVVAALEGEARAARQGLEARLGRGVEILADPGRTRESFDIRFG